MDWWGPQITPASAEGFGEVSPEFAAHFPANEGGQISQFGNHPQITQIAQIPRLRLG
jgi:hypothetical protein